MKLSNFQKSGIAVGIVVFVAILLVYQSELSMRKEPVLPYYGLPGNEGEPHYVKDFNLVNQNNVPVSRSMYQGKIFVAEFFFTTCLGICPIMTEEMIRVYKKYQSNPDILFISHTVDPTHDTPEVLARYAGNRKIEADKWNFVTGDKKEIYDLARYSYLVDATEGDNGPNDFVHTEKFALVDREGRIRGYYDGTDSEEVTKLMADIDLLLEE